MSSSFPNPLTEKEEQHYVELLAKNDPNARKVLIERNLRLVAHIAKKYISPGAGQDDLISIGTIGLIKAVNTYSSGKSTRLATYAAKPRNASAERFRSVCPSAPTRTVMKSVSTIFSERTAMKSLT